MSIGKVINIKHRENCSITDAEREMDLAISELKKYFAFTGRDDWLGNDGGWVGGLFIHWLSVNY